MNQQPTKTQEFISHLDYTDTHGVKPSVNMRDVTFTTHSGVVKLQSTEGPHKIVNTSNKNESKHGKCVH